VADNPEETTEVEIITPLLNKIMVVADKADTEVVATEVANNLILPLNKADTILLNRVDIKEVEMLISESSD
jgi:hypothetical protein